MKKRLLSAFLAVMMVLTMAPVAFAAEEAGNGDTLKKLFTDVKAGESGSGNVTVTIDKDYNLTGYNWTALTVDGYNGAGIVTVEGNNHTITGLNTSLFAGGFAGTSGIVIKDLTLDNVSIEDTTNEQGIGAFINNVDSMPKIELNNCHLTDSTITSTGGARVGGLIGWTSGYNKKDDGPVDTYITVTNCSVENTKITAKGSVGGIIGHAGANPATYHTFTNNTVTGCTLHSTDDGGWRVGVVVGTVNVGEVALNNTTESGNTVTQTGKTAPAGQSNLYGRFVPGTTGKLVIDGTAVFDSSIVAVVDNKGYKTLADAVAAAQGGATVKLLKDVTEDVVIPAGKTITLDLNGKKLTNKTGHTITVEQGATLTVTGKGTVDNVTHQKAAVWNNGICYLNGGTYDRSKENGKNANDSGSNSFYAVLNHGTMEINEGATVYQSGHYSSLLENGYQSATSGNQGTGYVEGTNAENPTLTINGGLFTGGLNTIKNDDNGIITIKDGTFTNYTQAAFMNHHVATIEGGVFEAENVAAVLNCGANCVLDATHDKHETTITNGYFKGALEKNFGKLEVSGGYFTVDPTEYLATYTDAKKKYIAKAVTGDYKFHVELADANDLQVVPVAGATAAPSKDELKNNKDIPSDQVDNIVTAAKAVSAPEISKAAQEVAANISDNSNTLGKQYQDAAKNEVPNQEKIEVRTYLEVKPKAYNGSAYTLDITPKYDVVVVGTKNGATAKKVVETNTLNVTKATEVSVQLPAGFVSDTNTKLYVQHKGHEYDAAVTANNGVYTANFTNPHGFSPFTISKTSQSVAKVGNNKYTTFQDAVNAVENNGTIEIVGGNKDYTATISGSSKTIKVKNSLTDKNIKVTVNGESKTIEPSKDATFTYTKPSSGGSSGGSSSGKTTYKVTTSAVNNGGVNASPSSAEKGATITITLSPDKGYKLDKLTVTDGSGKTVSTVKKSDTVYTFTMPASAVKVGVSYVKATETPSKTKFNDVSANDWFASAVDYVTGKGMMNGTADNTFSPKANTTRGMVVTVLYRLENQPSTSAASFTDVASGAYYANAVAWANANGIVSGYGSGKFGPNDKVTREQLAAILYRYAQYKKYDVSVGEDTNILSYDDAQSISTYAIPAIQWACGAGVVTGKSGSKLDPKGNATRAEVAAMLMRFCENVK
ncbi:S-layer homology domain-containing protein [Agathobaculum sp.]|uniref:S-layer homology domain-containing protein n=1 Tax=Agathobaculum TaxID=2048137 RepID=UPI003AB4D1DF